MEMVIQLLLLVLGFAFLVKGADWFVDGAAGIATRFGIPQLVIGLTIVAMGTSAPEAAVSITAAISGNAEITIGNIVGSNILNILIILGLSALFYPLSVAKSTLFVDIPVTIAITVLLYVLGLDGTINIVDGVIMLVVFISYLVYLFLTAKKSKVSVAETIKDGNSWENQSEKNQLSIPKSLIYTGVGLLLVVAGSKLVVDSASFIARVLGLSERFIGLTIVALGTSLPELFTSVSAAIKKNSDIAIGNIVGSNIFNILFVVGLSGVIIPVPFAPPFRFDTLISGLAALLLLLFCLPKKKLGRVAGVILLLCYIAYFIAIW
ncbi:MAG: calcium/sodium antiporter [Spirochaetaceae bacterium]|nr:calcium/sodium antiporter [Spirochaetaceae bacterium]